MPRDGDVLLVHEAQEAPVRFFLPLNAGDVLARKGLRIIDPEKTFRFDDNTYRLPAGARTPADEQYEALRRRIEQFGFTWENRAWLNRLAAEFEALARQDPSHYRLMQLDVIRNHQEVWRYAAWEKLADATQAVRGILRLPARPPAPLQPLPVRPLTPRPSR